LTLLFEDVSDVRHIIVQHRHDTSTCHSLIMSFSYIIIGVEVLVSV